MGEGIRPTTAPAEVLDQRLNFFASAALRLRVADNAFFDEIRSDLELRLDEQRRFGFRRGERQNRRQDQRQRNETDVADDELRRLRQIGGDERPGVAAFPAILRGSRSAMTG